MYTLSWIFNFQGIGPKWVLFNLAGLYWRINGNNYHGIECLRRAIYFAPSDYKDVPLVNLANILYKWGRVDDAVTVMRDAVKINDLEVKTNSTKWNEGPVFFSKHERI